MMESVARPVVGRLQLDEFACRQLDRVSSSFFASLLNPRRPIFFMGRWGWSCLVIVATRVIQKERAGDYC